MTEGAEFGGLSNVIPPSPRRTRLSRCVAQSELNPGTVYTFTAIPSDRRQIQTTGGRYARSTIGKYDSRPHISCARFTLLLQVESVQLLNSQFA
jgi:hypothetical protein